MTYEIRADAKKYAEYAVDENGKLTYELHAFEGADLISYKIVRTEDSEMIDDGFDTFEDAKKALSETNTCHYAGCDNPAQCNMH